MAALERVDVMASVWEPDRRARTREGRLIEAAKDRGDDAAVALLAEQAAAWGSGLGDVDGVVVVPVPPSPDRPNRLVPAVAAALAATWQVPLIAAVERHAVTARLRDLEPAERADAAAAADYRLVHEVEGVGVVLVDDVVLTGTTLEHLASILRGHGAAPVRAAVLARSRRG